MVCLSITSTEAGISRTVSPNRDATFGDDIGVERRLGDLASARDRCWRRHRGLAYVRGLQPVRRVRLRCVPGSALRTGLRCGGVTTTGPRLSGCLLLRLRRGLCHDRRGDAGSNERKKAERRDGRAQQALDRVTVALIGENLTEMKTRARNTWRKMTMIAGNSTIYRSTAKHYSVSAVAVHSALAPSGRYTSYSCDIGAPRPTRSRMTMTGSRFPGSRVIASDHLPRNPKVPSGIYGRRLSAYSCGGSRGFALPERAPHSLG